MYIVQLSEMEKKYVLFQRVHIQIICRYVMRDLLKHKFHSIFYTLRLRSRVKVWIKDESYDHIGIH